MPPCDDPRTAIPLWIDESEFGPVDYPFRFAIPPERCIQKPFRTDHLYNWPTGSWNSLAGECFANARLDCMMGRHCVCRKQSLA